MRNAIESVLAQTFGDFELLISDDRSDDASSEIISQYASQDHRIGWWTNQERLGLFANYNRCIEKARGQFIKPFAQDDLWDKELLAELVALMDEHPEVSLAATRRLEIDEFGQEITVNRAAELIDFLSYKRVYPAAEVMAACLDYTLVNLIGEPCAVMFRRRDAGRGFPTNFRHVGDIEYWLRILESGDFGLVEKPLASFRKHKGSTSTVNITQLWFLTDLVHIAYRFSHQLGRGKSTPEEFIRRNFAAASLEVPQLIGGKFDIRAIRDEDEYSPSDIVALKKSFFIALSMLAELLSAKENTYISQFDPEVAFNEKQIAALEQELRTMLESGSWKATRWLREANRLLMRNQQASSDDLQLTVAQSSVEKQRLYLEYLKSKRAKILSSRSWQITSRFRRDFNHAERAGQAVVQPKDSGKADSRVAGKPSAYTVFSSTGSAQSLNSPRSSSASSPRQESALANASVESSLPSWNGRRGRLHKIDSQCEKPYDLLLTIHECTLTGAPMLALSLIKTLVSRGLKCLVIAKKDGKLLREFRAICDVLDLSATTDFGAALDNELTNLAESGILRPNTVTFVNTAELHGVCEIFHAYSCKVIALIHEFLSDYSSQASINLARYSETVVFSARATLDDAVNNCNLAAETRIIQQGLVDSKVGLFGRERGKDFLFERYGIERDAFVALACGTADPRKGIDIFTQAAIDLFSRFEQGIPNLHFIWIGGESPVTNVSLAWASRDIKKSGLEKHVHFVGEQEKVDAFFAGADIFLLPSRQDPMPLVAQLAQLAGLPVIAFAGSGGAAELLAGGGGRLVPYGNASAMAESIIEYYRDRVLWQSDSQMARRNLATQRSMDDYADDLLGVAGWKNEPGRDGNGVTPAVNIEPPLPPQELRYLVTGSSSISGFLSGGKETAGSIIDVLRANGIDPSRLNHILDFGCGCGRVMRHLSKMVPARMYGVDYNPKFIDWLGRAFPAHSFSVNQLSPPTHFASNSFDLIYAISVFTHLTEEQQLDWMNEFARILKPGGFLILTTHGDHEVYAAAMTEAERQVYDSRQYFVSQASLSGKNECFTRQSIDHVKRVLCQGFEMVDFNEFGALGTGNQDLYLLRSRKASTQPVSLSGASNQGKALFFDGAKNTGSVRDDDGVHSAVNVHVDHNSIKWQTRLAIATMFQNEARFLEEWIEYHRLIGVEKFILFNNLSDDNYKEVLKDYLKHEIVDLVEWPFESVSLPEYVAVQCRAFDSAITRASGSVKWLSLQDTDEFLVPLEGDDVLPIIDEFSHHGGLAVAYRFFGTSFVEKVSDGALLIESLNLAAPCESVRNSKFKSIVRPERVRAFKSPHFADFSEGFCLVDEAGEQVENPEGRLPSSRIRFNHYWSRDERFFNEQKRANVLQWGVSAAEIDRSMKELNSVKDTAILKFAEPLRQNLMRRQTVQLS